MGHGPPHPIRVIAVALPRAKARGDARTELAARALAIARSTALGVLGDHAAAEDVAQEVAIVAIQRARQLRDPAKLDAWLHKVAVRKAIDEARKFKPTVELQHHHEQPQPDPATSEALDLLAPLAPRQRAALTLRYVHDLPDDAIATALGCRPATVRSLLSRGREALRETLETER